MLQLRSDRGGHAQIVLQEELRSAKARAAIKRLRRPALKRPGWSAGAVTVLWLLLVPTAGRTQPPAQVFLVLERSPGVADTALMHAILRDSALSLPSVRVREQILRAPSCTRPGCRQITISGRRLPWPQYRLQRLDPSGAPLVTTIRFAADARSSEIARALVVKAAYLLGQPPPMSIASPASVSAAKRAAAASSDRSGRTHGLSLGPAMTLGLDSAFATFGVELAATLGLGGPFACRIAVGYEDLGQAEGVDYRTLPLLLALGARFEGRRFGVGAFGGLSMTPVWLKLGESVGGTATQVLLGGSIEGTSWIRLHRRFSIVLSLRATFVPDEIEIGLDGNQTLRLPRWLLAATLGLGASF